MKIQFLAALAAATALVGCDRPSERAATDPAAERAEKRDQALVRVVHAMSQAPQADVYTGSEKAFSGVGFGTATSYKPVPEEQFMLTLKPAGQPNGPVMIEAKEGVDPGRRYTILAMPDRDGAAKIDVVTDDVQTPQAGKALVRIINVAPESGSAELYAATKANEPVIDGIDYGGPARYEEVDPAELTLRVNFKPNSPMGSKDRVPAIVEKTLIESGKAYTLVVAPNDSPDAPLRLIKIEDPVASQTAVNADDDVSGKTRAIQREEERK
jgi:hypothetical protein